MHEEYCEPEQGFCHGHSHPSTRTLKAADIWLYLPLLLTEAGWLQAAHSQCLLKFTPQLWPGSPFLGTQSSSLP